MGTRVGTAVVTGAEVVVVVVVVDVVVAVVVVLVVDGPIVDVVEATVATPVHKEAKVGHVIVPDQPDGVVAVPARPEAGQVATLLSGSVIWINPLLQIIFMHRPSHPGRTTEEVVCFKSGAMKHRLELPNEKPSSPSNEEATREMSSH